MATEQPTVGLPTPDSTSALKTKKSKKQKFKEVAKMKTKKDKIRVGVAVGGFLVVVAAIITGAVLGARAAKNKNDDPDTTTAPPDPTPEPTGEPPEASYRLPLSLKPQEYLVQLQPFINGNWSIAGYEEVHLHVAKETNNITIHMVDIEVDFGSVTVTVNDKRRTPIEVTDHTYDEDREWCVFFLKETLQVNQTVKLSMNFTSHLKDNLRGFYKSSYKEDNETTWLAVTQFEPADARRAFPCLDEPAMKATFTISLARENHMISRSNMPLREEQDGEAGWKWDHYLRTPRMSTYLVAFLVADFHSSTSQGPGNWEFSVWTRRDALAFADYALEVGPILQKFFEDEYRIPYPLPKQDLVALPDFSMGAMENWGLITFREEAMLLNETTASASYKQRVTEIIAHELAHQWFGNLVTPSWWTDIWLNEGFASYMASVAVGSLQPKWDMMDQLVLVLQGVMGPDSLTSSHPVSQEVEKPDQLGQIFDSISYDKGASIIRMMNFTLTEETFKKGITNYLNNSKFDVATQDDLWDSLTQAAEGEGNLPPNTTVKDIMNTWTLQTGYPVVTATRSADGKTATITQERFLLMGNSSGEAAAYSWWVPLSFTSADEADFADPKPTLWLPPSNPTIDVPELPAKEKWVIFNLQAAGYFRVNYDEDNWARITEQLLTNHEAIHVVNRAQLMDDAFNLARSGHLDYKIALGLTDYLGNETDYVPWSAALSSFSYLEEMLTRTAAYGNLVEYLLGKLEPMYNAVDFEDDPDDGHLRQLTRSLVVDWSCKLGLEDCVTKANTNFDDWLGTGKEVSSNVKSTVYCTGVAEGDEATWEAVWNKYQETTDAREQSLILRALGCTKQISLLSRYLDMAFRNDSGIRKKDSGLVFSAVAGNDIGQPLAWKYLRNNWESILDYYTAFSTLGSLFTAVSSEFNTNIERFELSHFYKENGDTLTTATRDIEIAIDNAAANTAWMDSYYGIIEDFLENTLTPTTPSST